MSTTEARLVDALCAAVEREPGGAEPAVRAQIRRLAPLAGPDESERLVRAAVARLDGLGPLDALLGRPERSTRCWSTAGATSGSNAAAPWNGGGRSAPPTSPSSSNGSSHHSDGASTGPHRSSTPASPTARACAPSSPPIALDGTCLSLRRFRRDPLPLDAFAGPAAVGVLRELMIRRCNLVISGATSSGKTSLLASLLGLVEPGERILTLEDTAELAPATDHVVRLEARPGTADGLPAIGLDQLVRTALRLRPDRLVVGEVRGAEVLGLVQALNTGHDGSLSTVHANSALDALHRLETLVVQSAPSWPLTAIRSHLARCIDVGRARRATGWRPAPGRRDRRGRPRPTGAPRSRRSSRPPR